jgi:hypothetical protein
MADNEAQLDLGSLLSRAKIFLDLSRIFPARIFFYLLAFLPGVLFVVAILLGNPTLIRCLIGRLKSAALPHIPEYLIVSVILILMFAIGLAFMLVDALVAFVMTYLYRFSVFCWKQLCRSLIRRIVAQLRKHSFWSRRRWLILVDRYALSKGYELSEGWQKVQSLWRKCARKLVKARYGLDPADLEDSDMEALYWTLGFPIPEETRADMFLVACHAMGWAGLCACSLAPALKNEYFVVFCIFLIVNGLLHDYYLVKRRVDPKISGTLAIRSILKGLRENTEHVAK